MADEKRHKTAFERAARAVHENYYGVGSWKAAGPTERSHARQAIRLAVSALTKNGLMLDEGGPAAKAPVPRRF